MTVSLTGTPLEGTVFEQRLHRLQRQRDHALRGDERKGMSPQLAEALRAEIRAALDANGKPFDVNVARRVYDLAIAARDMCVAATSGVKEAIDTIKDVGGPIESLDSPDTPESQLQASETFGARLIREVLATLPKLQQRSNGDDPKALVHALAEARRNGMSDVAEELEIKLFGRTLSNLPRPIAAAIETPPFDHSKRTTKHFENLLGYCVCEHCKQLPMHEPITVQSGPKFTRPPSGMENASDPKMNGQQLADDGNVPRYDDTEQRGRPSNRVPMDPIEREELEGK